MKIARLTFDSTLRSADARYLAGMEVHDPFVGMVVGGKRIAVASALELGNFKKNSACDGVLSMEALLGKQGAELRGVKRSVATIVAAAKKLGVTKIEVGPQFPVAIFVELKKAFKVEVVAGALFPERLIKSAEELREIRLANVAVAGAIDIVRQGVRMANVVKGRLVDRTGKPVTSEGLREKANLFFAHNGMVSVEPAIIACGVQGCNPHEIGHGQLAAGELIVVDIFAPRAVSGYWGDMSRTFIKGTPSDAQVDLVEAVKDAQEMAIEFIEPGMVAGDVHQAVCDFFEAIYYPTGKTKSGYEGFFHGLGHGLGLECHDVDSADARLGRGVAHKLQVGEVYTVEPGLYYREIGGCRIEDNGVVTEKGYKLLSKSDYEWVL